MRFFKLVQQHNRSWALANGFGELPALLVSHVARRRANQTVDRVAFVKLRKIQPQERVVTIKKSVRNGFGRLGFANACRAQQKE